jgi:hypothetical protein
VCWWQRAVFYEIYIRSFQDSNGDGIGDVNGITSRLDSLEDLGVDAVWITELDGSPWRVMLSSWRRQEAPSTLSTCG